MSDATNAWRALLVECARAVASGDPDRVKLRRLCRDAKRANAPPPHEALAPAEALYGAAWSLACRSPGRPPQLLFDRLEAAIEGLRVFVPFTPADANAVRTRADIDG